MCVVFVVLMVFAFDFRRMFKYVLSVYILAFRLDKITEKKNGSNCADESDNVKMAAFTFLHY